MKHLPGRQPPVASLRDPACVHQDLRIHQPPRSSPPIAIAAPTTITPSQSEPYLAETIATYDIGAEEYAKRYSGVDLTPYLDQFVDRLPSRTGPVVDAGCGPGRDLTRFSERGVRAIGVDRSRAMLSQCPKLKGVTLVEGDIRWLPLGTRSMAGVWHCASLLHLAPGDAQLALREVQRVLQPGGILFLSTAHGCGSEWRAGSLGGRRWFHYYGDDEIATLTETAGLRVSWVAVEPGIAHGSWVNMFAERPC
jgi:SAM-dependent methyltransferase